MNIRHLKIIGKYTKIVIYLNWKREKIKNKVKLVVIKKTNMKGMIEINGNIYFIAINKTIIVRLFKTIDH